MKITVNKREERKFKTGDLIEQISNGKIFLLTEKVHTNEFKWVLLYPYFEASVSYFTFDPDRYKLFEGTITLQND